MVPKFTSDNKFIIPAGTVYSFAKATGSPNAYVGTGLPGGLLLNPVDGNLSGIPATAGTYQPNLRAVYADGSQATQSYEIEVLAGPPQVTCPHLNEIVHPVYRFPMRSQQQGMTQ